MPVSHRACRTGKRKYPAQDAAKKAITVIRQVGERREKNPERCYLCPFCGKWHLTSQA